VSNERVATRRDFRVTGVVQGVGFRWSAARRAEALRLRGWVRNCADGSVEAGAEGDETALDQFEEWLRHGPRGARVDRVERIAPTLEIAGDGFLIAR
jgi:acylphosphatase